MPDPLAHLNQGYSYAADDSRFLDYAARSEPWRFAVVTHLEAIGERLKVKPMQLRPHHSQRRKFKDGGDIWTEDGRLIEVKGMFTAHWNDRRNFPKSEGHQPQAGHMIIDDVYKVHEKPVFPWAYFRVNACKSLALVAYDTSRPQWIQKEVYTRVSKRWNTLYLCPLKWTHLVPLHGATSMCPRCTPRGARHD